MISLSFSLLFLFFTLILGVTLVGVVKTYSKSVVANVFVFLAAIPTTIFAGMALLGNAQDASFYTGSFLGFVNFRIDALSAWFIIIINITTITGAFYGINYLKNKNQQFDNTAMHWSVFLIFHQSMLWVCMVQNGFAFLIIWEIMSLSSMMLVIYENKNMQVIKAGINYLVQMHISIVFLTIGFLWLYFYTKSVNFEYLGVFFESNRNLWLFLMFFIGFGIKAGFIPFHSWLPHAHPAAPSHVSGIMSGAIVKLGIFGILKVLTYIKAEFIEIGALILIVGILSGLYGIIQAAVQKDFKKMLAFCTIENIGIIGVGIGIGLIGLGANQPVIACLGFVGALIHVLNHALYKSLLFFAAGSVYKIFHSRNINKLGGVVKHMPQTTFIFLIGTIAIVGLPPLNGFISEFLIYSGLFKGLFIGNMAQIGLFALGFIGLSIIGGLAIITFSKTFAFTFLGSPRDLQNNENKHEVPGTMLLPQYVIISIMFFIALFPNLIINLAAKPVSVILQNNYNSFFILVNHTGFLFKINLYCFILVVLVVVILWFKYLLAKRNVISTNETWGCGYVAPVKKAQYTAESYTWSLSKSFNFIIAENKNYVKHAKGEIFPIKRKFSTNFFDLFEIRLFIPAIRRLFSFSNYFNFIQNGKIQSYVIYGVVFILLIMLFSFFRIF